jgi:hypothetical protein
MWFAGTGQTGGATQTRLYLMNTGNVAASVNVTILTDTGQQNGLNNAITVAPGQFVTENVAPFISGSQALALHVQTTVGQVTASVWQGGTAGGAWLPQAAAPATTLVIPGLTVASSAAKLFVVVPGSTDAQVKVVAYTPAGAVPQFPAAPVDASAGAATPVSLNSLGAAAAGLKLTSNVPIVAGVLVPGTGMGAFTTAVPPVTGQGVVAGNPAARGVTVGLLLTAPSAAVRASISVISPDGTATTPPGGDSVTVAPGHTLAVAVPRPTGGREPFAIVVKPQAGSGPLYAVRVVTSGTGGMSAPVTSLLPVPSAVASIELPPAENSYSAVMPLPPGEPGRDGGLVKPAAITGIHRVGVEAKEAGELFDDDVEYQVAQLSVALRPGHERAPVDHDARGRGRAGGVARLRRTGDGPGQRQRDAVVDEFLRLRNLLNGELHSGQFGLPAGLEPGYRVKHHVVELLRPGAVQRHSWGHEPTADTAPVPVAPPDPRGMSGPVLATVHSYREYRGRAPAG